MSKRNKRKKEITQPTAKEKLLSFLCRKQAKFILASLIITAVISAFGTNFFTPKPKSPIEREQILLTWFRTMAVIAEATQDPGAKEVLTFLHKNYAIGIPMETEDKEFFFQAYRNGKKLSQQETEGNTVIFFIVQPGEPIREGIGDSLEDTCFYVHKDRQIFVDGQRFKTKSLTSMAFTLFHEGFHALDDYDAKYQDLSYENTLEEERRAHIFHRRIVIKYLGDAVWPIIREMRRHTNATAVKIPNSKYVEFGWDEDYNHNSLRKKLKAIMWSVRSDAEVKKVFALLREHVLYIKIHESTSLSAEEYDSVERHIIIEPLYKKRNR